MAVTLVQCVIGVKLYFYNVNLKTISRQAFSVKFIRFNFT